MSWCTPLFPGHGRQRQVVLHEFEACLVYTVSFRQTWVTYETLFQNKCFNDCSLCVFDFFVVVGFKNGKMRNRLERWLGRLAALAALGRTWVRFSVLTAHIHLYLQCQGILPTLLTSTGTRHVCGAHTHTEANTHTYKIKTYKSSLQEEI